MIARIFAVLVAAVSLQLGAVAQSDETTPWFSQTVESEASTFIVTLEATEGAFAINEFRIWQLTVIDKNSEIPIEVARISVSGGMPMHGHGLPTQPQVTGYLGHGKYQIDGLKFNMLGKWMMQFDITTKTASDTVSFEVVLDY